MATDPVPVDDALHDLDGDYLTCRDLHHAWKVDHYAAARGGAIGRTLVCTRCGTERSDEWTASGGRVGASYRYPDGYQMPRGTIGAGDREAMRREVLRRAGVTNGRRRRR